MSEVRRVPVSEISQRRLSDWLADCERDHATPFALLAIGHDERSGELHVYRTENGPSDADVGALMAQAALMLMHS